MKFTIAAALVATLAFGGDADGDMDFSVLTDALSGLDGLTDDLSKQMEEAQKQAQALQDQLEASK